MSAEFNPGRAQAGIISGNMAEGPTNPEEQRPQDGGEGPQRGFFRRVRNEAQRRLQNLRGTREGQRQGERGETRAERQPQASSFRTLLNEKLRLVHAGVQEDDSRVQEIDNRIGQVLESREPLVVYQTLNDTEAFLSSLPTDASEPSRQLRSVAERVLSQEDRESIRRNWDELDNRYKELEERIPDKRRAFAKIDQAAQRALSNLRYATSSLSVDEIIMAAARESRPEELPGFEGIMEWYAIKQIENVNSTYEVQTREELSADPEKNIEAAYILMQFAEKSGTRAAFSESTRHLQTLLKAVESSSSIDPERTRILREHINAFIRLTPVFITMKETSGNVKAMSEALQGIENNTFLWYYDRFNYDRIRDKRGGLYLVNENGEVITGTENALSIAENALIRQYFIDRFRMNKVQELTKRDSLNLRTGDVDEKWLIAYTMLDKSEFDSLTEENLDEKISTIRNVGDWANKDKKIKAVRQWYQRQTLIGAGETDERGEYLERGKERRVLKENQIIKDGLRGALSDNGVRSDRIDAMLDDDELMGALARNAGALVTFKFSGLDRMRVFDDDKIVSTIKGQNTPYFGWQTDHVLDFFITEGHGDERVVREIMKFIDKNWSPDGQKDSGFMLAQLMPMVRIVNQDGVLDENGSLKREIEHVADDASERNDKEDKGEARPYSVAHILFEGYDGTHGAAIEELFKMDQSKKAKYLTKDDLLVDNGEDRVSGFGFYNGKFKAFTFNPDEKELFAMLGEYYSSRHVRKRPAMEFFLEVYWNVGKNWKEWFNYQDNLQSTAMELVMVKAQHDNIIDVPRAKKLRDRLLSPEPIRTIKQLGTLSKETVVEFLSWRRIPSEATESFFDWLKTLYDLLTKVR